MVRKDLSLTIPSFFKCPISLDVMDSPVSLSTGVTYDRISIQTWFDNGNNTCPATMQILQSKDLVPNHTLKRLIQIWSESSSSSSSPSSSPSPSPSQSSNSPLLLSQENTKKLVKNLLQDPNPIASLSKISDFLKDSDKNKDFLINAGCIPVLADFLAANCEKLERLEEAVRILCISMTNYKVEEEAILYPAPDLFSSLLLLLQKGKLDSRIDSARVLEAIAGVSGSKSKLAMIGEREENILFQLIKIIRFETDKRAIDAGLSCLIAVSSSKRIRLQIVRLGSVHVLAKLISEQDQSISITEKVMKLLERISTCTEGRSEICEDPVCIPAMLQTILKVSNSATEHAVVVVWSVCHLFRDQRAIDAVAGNNGLAKILLLMQSNCSPEVRRMSGDLLKMFRLNSNASLNSNRCLSSYDTKTTHIMPF
ncbi:U-box domain-containing protein 28-like [Tasmannia lanceolata]|uniref:U-box domain-containing protein 28-like n=1 Tax=Tasmannia lanceolata TaxID=3420 RepID=UPI004064BF06